MRRQYGGVDYEHVVTDDRSDDGTWELLQEIAANDEHLVPVRTRRNGGPSHALNLAFDASTGDFVLPLDDDDLLLPWSLSMHADFLDAHPEVDLAFGWAVLIDAQSKLDLWGFAKYGVDLERTPYSDASDEFLDIMWASNSIFNSTAVARRSCVATVGGWDENVSCQDWALWLALLENDSRHKRNPNYLSAYRIHDSQLTATHMVDGTYGRDATYLKKRFNRRG